MDHLPWLFVLSVPKRPSGPGRTLKTLTLRCTSQACLSEVTLPWNGSDADSVTLESNRLTVLAAANAVIARMAIRAMAIPLQRCRPSSPAGSFFICSLSQRHRTASTLGGQLPSGRLLRQPGGGTRCRDPAFQRAACPVDRCRVLADCELRVGEGHVRV